MLSKIKRMAARHLSNLPGWRTNRKIVVFESDDWGSIRMPSKGAFERLKKAGVDLFSFDSERYNQNDSLATSTDLEMLFDVLLGFKDVYGNNVIFTPITIVANPDFEKIKQSGYEQYFYEPFPETLKRYPNCDKSFSLWLEGIKNKVFLPQMHGREHLNVSVWLKSLQMADRNTLIAFKEGCWGFVPDQKKLPNIEFQAAFLLDDPSELETHKQIIKEGLVLFEKLFGHRAKYFVPPNGPFNNKLNETLAESGIQFRSSAKLQKEPLGNGEFRKSFHWLGQKEKHGITYITRNCFFEPSQPGKDWVKSCLGELEIAFRMKKPAIISTHRVNYIGALNTKNREEGLRQLNVLLSHILKKWPDVEFMSSESLGKLISRKKQA